MWRLDRSEARCRSVAAKAQKVLPGALRCAVPAPHKPWVTFPGDPSNACVRPTDGFTAIRKMTYRASWFKPQTASTYH